VAMNPEQAASFEQRARLVSASVGAASSKNV
jgi:hypothetical protein